MRARGIDQVARREAKRAVLDIGRYGRDQVRKNAPKRSGQLRTSIKLSVVKETDKSASVTISSDLPRARWLEGGTGLYGPRRRRIVPVTAKALAWKTTGARTYGVKGGRIGPAFASQVLVSQGIARRKGKIIRSPKRSAYMHFAMSVRGIRPMRFFERGLKGPELAAYRRKRLAEMMQRIKAGAE